MGKVTDSQEKPIVIQLSELWDSDINLLSKAGENLENLTLRLK